MSKTSGILENQIEVSDLFHIYGDLLSDRQRTFIRLYYDENLSLSEIANQHEISRQAVHDAIKHGRKALAKYEGTLNLLETQKIQGVVPSDASWRSQAETILDEMEIAVAEQGPASGSRLLAQIASMKKLLGRGGDNSPIEQSSRHEEAFA